MTISEISSQLDKAVVGIQSKLAARITAQKTYETAAAEYDTAIDAARQLREQLNTELDKLMPTARVR